MRIRVCGLDEIEADTSKRFDIEDLRIAIIRIGDDFYAIGDECSHADFSLSEGELEPDDCTIECPKHGALFDVKTGEPLTLPALKAVPVYIVVVEDDSVFVETQQETPEEKVPTS